MSLINKINSSYHSIRKCFLIICVFIIFNNMIMFVILVKHSSNSFLFDFKQTLTPKHPELLKIIHLATKLCIKKLH